MYHDVEAGYEISPSIQLRIGVNNLTDEDSPFVDDSSQANTDAATYRLLGRTFFAQRQVKLR